MRLHIRWIARALRIGALLVSFASLHPAHATNVALGAYAVGSVDPEAGFFATDGDLSTAWKNEGSGKAPYDALYIDLGEPRRLQFLRVFWSEHQPKGFLISRASEADLDPNSPFFGFGDWIDVYQRDPEDAQPGSPDVINLSAQDLTYRYVAIFGAAGSNPGGDPPVHTWGVREVQVHDGPMTAEPGIVGGRLIDARTQAALAGRTVTITRLPDGPTDAVLTGDDGRFTTMLPPGTYGFLVEAPGYAAFEAAAVVVMPGEEVTVDAGLTPEPSVDDTVRALRVASGLSSATREDMARLDVDNSVSIGLPDAFQHATAFGCELVQLQLFRDADCSEVLDDWPDSGSMPRSPKWLFGKDAPICIRVGGFNPGTPELTVNVRSETDPAGVDIPLKKVGSIYQSTAADGTFLYLADRTTPGPPRYVLHVKDEEVITAHIKGYPGVDRCEVRVMVDRGESAAVTPVDVGWPGAMQEGFVSAAGAFMTGMFDLGPFTTGWWNAGLSLRTADGSAIAAFIKAAGNGSPENAEADILHAGGHSNVHGYLGGNLPGGYQRNFGPERTSYQQKDPGGSPGDPLEHPEDWFFHTAAVYPADKTFGDPPEWDTDIDWTMLYSCRSLNDNLFDVGTTEQGRFVPLTPPQRILPWQRWIRAFRGQPRGLHGIMGFHGNGSGSNQIAGVIHAWTGQVQANQPIGQAWLKATADNSDPGAVLFLPRNWADTIHGMQQDPAPGATPIYLRTGYDDRTRRKVLKNGEFLGAGGRKPADDTVYDTLLRTPKGVLLAGACRLFIDLPTTSGTFRHLLIQRDEQPSAGSVFQLSTDGEYVFGADGLLPLAPNTLSPVEAQTAFRDFLAYQFATLPAGLEPFGAFPRTASTAYSEMPTGFDVFLEQRHGGLPVFNGAASGVVGSAGSVHSARAVWYDVQETGASASLISAQQAAEIAAADLLANHPEVPCNLTDMLAYYAHPQPVGNSTQEVRPVWAMEFHLGGAAYLLDALTGAILEVDIAAP